MEESTPFRASKQLSPAQPKVTLCSEFSDKFNACVADAKDSAREYVGDSWTGDFPKDWKEMIRKGNKFILHLSSVGYAVYEKWGTHAVWIREYDADAKATGDKIEEIQGDWSGMAKFSDWRYDEVTTKMQEMRKKVELEIIRVEGVKTVD